MECSGSMKGTEWKEKERNKKKHPCLAVRLEEGCEERGMLDVPWLAVELREWFASTRSTLFLIPLKRSTSHVIHDLGLIPFPFPLCAVLLCCGWFVSRFLHFRFVHCKQTNTQPTPQFTQPSDNPLLMTVIISSQRLSGERVNERKRPKQNTKGQNTNESAWFCPLFFWLVSFSSFTSTVLLCSFLLSLLSRFPHFVSVHWKGAKEERQRVNG